MIHKRIFVDRRMLFRSFGFLLCSAGLTGAALAALETSPSFQAEVEKLKAEQARSGKSEFTPEEMAVMKRAKASLAKRMPEPGLKSGTRAPDFVLPDAFGKTVRLSEELKKGPVVLVFYRGAWCPFCNLHLKVLQQSLPEIKSRGAQLIAITPQKPNKSAEQFNKTGYPFTVLSDLESHVMKAYGLYFELEPGLVSLYKKHGLDVEAYNGKGRTILPVPGTFVIDRDGVIRAAQADTDYKKRMEPADIVAALQKLSTPTLTRE